jgi:methylaspartate ammonia-lyase
MAVLTICDYPDCGTRATCRITVEEIGTITQTVRAVDCCDIHSEQFKIGGDDLITPVSITLMAV